MAAGGREVAVDGNSESRYQVCLPQPTRGLHEDDILQTLDREGDRSQVLMRDALIVTIICDKKQ